MGKLSRAAIGALFLPVGFLPSTAMAATAPTDTPTVSGTSAAAPTDSPDPVSTLKPTGTPTDKPTGKPATPPATRPATPPADPTTGSPVTELLSGTLTSTPAAGPAGTTITISSVTPCVDAQKKVATLVDVMLLSLEDVTGPDDDFLPVTDKVVATAKDGGWTAKLTTPASAKNGDAYVVTAACLTGDPETDPNVDTFLVYDPELFMTADAPAAPVADPVTKAPSFTG